MDAAVQLPREQGLRQKILHGRFGGKCRDPESGRSRPAHQPASSPRLALPAAFTTTRAITPTTSRRTSSPKLRSSRVGVIGSCSASAVPSVTASIPLGGTPYNSTVWGGGVGGGFRGPLVSKKITIGLKGLYGEGVGRYGSSTIADVTLRPDGTISPLHGFSASAPWK